MKTIQVDIYLKFIFLCFIVIIISCNNKESNKSHKIENSKYVIDSSDKTVVHKMIRKNIIKEYESVNIGEQAWMTNNLNISVFRNGDSISHAKTKAEWEKAGKEGKPAWCYYDNDEENGEKYGKLYNWYAIDDSRGLAPEGWMVPNENDWKQLIKHLGGLNVLSVELMSKTGWKYENGTNKSGFNTFPGGGRFLYGKFDNLLTDAYYWSSSSYPKKIDLEDRAFCFILNYELPMLTSFSKNYGLSVRCIKNK